jgi:hypothetical protein
MPDRLFLTSERVAERAEKGLKKATGSKFGEFRKHGMSIECSGIEETGHREPSF